MRRFRILFLLFSVALLAPLGLLVHRALQSLALEQQVRHQTVAERIFDEMERALSRVLEDEEKQPFDRYGADTAPRTFVLGRFQIDPDGAIHPLPLQAPPSGEAAEEMVDTIGTYWRAARAASSRSEPMDGKRRDVDTSPPRAAQSPGTTLRIGDERAFGIAESRGGLLADSADDKKGVSAFDALRSLNKGASERAERQNQAAEYAPKNEADARLGSVRERFMAAAPSRGLTGSTRSEIDFPPMTGRIIDARHLMLYRTVAWGAMAYRQGMLLDVERLGAWLREQGLGNDGLASYAAVSFATPLAPLQSAARETFSYQHRFGEPFDDLTARLNLQPLPGLGSVTYVYTLSALLLFSGVFGLGALYRMVSVVVSYAERRNNFVAAVSHELKTPLTAIRMYGEMLRDGMVPSEAKRAEYYRHITVESERLSRLINNVLELSRIEKGNRDVTLALGMPGPVVHDVAELLRPHARDRGFDLETEIDEQVPAVRFERDALVQVLCNLVDNAIKYAANGSDKRITLSCRRDADGVCVGVRDRGPGVPPRHLGKIFDAFYRGESELIRTSKGVGLGLALVRGLGERMGARVSGHNSAEGGFEVTLSFRAEH